MTPTVTPEAGFSDAAYRVLSERYLQTIDGRKETWDDLCWRVANVVAEGERGYVEKNYVKDWAEKFHDIIYDRKFIPGSPILSNAGKKGMCYSSCFVLPIEDDTQSIMDTLKNAVMVHRAGGGTGFSFSRLRPKGSTVSTSENGVASGPVSFLRMYDAATAVIKQGGTRRGANMGILRVDHPDILDFIECKLDGSITNFNISVGITDLFMDCLINHPTDPWAVRDPHTGEQHVLQPGCPISALEVWQRIIEAAHTTGDPGLVFLDRINASTANPIPSLGPIEATNPCVTGDTMIATLDGPQRFSDLTEDTLVFAWNIETKQPAVKWLRRPHMTRRGVPILKVTFDSGLSVRCTPDHSFYTFRGRKVQAQDLTIGKSVRAFAVSRHRDGHLRAHAGDSAPKYVARLVYEECIGAIPEGQLVHHRDGDFWNNSPENFELKTPITHNQEHYPKRHANGLDGWKPGEMSQDTKDRIALGVSRHYQEVRNHKVVAVEEDGYADVYNGVVDDLHTYIICDPRYRGASEMGWFSGIVSANCGEQPLYPYDVCNLGSINLGKYVVDSLTDGSQLDEVGLKDDIDVAVRFLDNVIDVNEYPLPEIEKVAKGARRIGLGVMGWADLLMQLRLPYASDEAISLAEHVMKLITSRAHEASASLAEERGSFPLWDKSIFAGKQPMRNATCTTIAPTGTISIIADASSGIEPVFKLEYEHDNGLGRKMIVRNQTYQDYLESPSGIRDARHEAEVFVGAHDVAPIWHLRHQAAFQKYVDNAISKTINLSHDGPVETIDMIYRMAYESDCMGITVYRDGSKDKQVLNSIKPQEEANAAQPALVEAFSAATEVDQIRELSFHSTRSVRSSDSAEPAGIKSAPLVVRGTTRTIRAPEGAVRVTINRDAEGPVELYVNVGRAGADIAAMAEAIGRLSSLVLRTPSDIPPTERLRLIAEQLHGLGGSRSVGFGPEQVRSLPDAIARAIKDELGDAQASNGHDPIELAAPFRLIAGAAAHWTGNLCPQCGSITLAYEEGCKKCHGCGYSEC